MTIPTYLNSLFLVIAGWPSCRYLCIEGMVTHGDGGGGGVLVAVVALVLAVAA